MASTLRAMASDLLADGLQLLADVSEYMTSVG